MENLPADKFELICRNRDSQTNNLNKLFASYGCQTLEARIPIVNNGVAQQVKNQINTEFQRYETLALKSEAASNAVDGRITRTRNRQLTLVEIGRDVVIAAGKERDRSPVDRVELDGELDEYMKVVAEMRAKKVEVQKEKVKAREERKKAFYLPELQALQLDEPNWDE